LADLDYAARIAAAAEEMRSKAIEREIKTETRETLPDEVRMVIDQIVATVKDHERRLVMAETFQEALIREATRKMQGAA
jgi:hypothetical protein